jgi:hypothetical protein
LDFEGCIFPKLFWVKPKSSFAVLKQRSQLLVMCHYILNIQIFLTNIRNGGIRMQRYFFVHTTEHILNTCLLKWTWKESHKSISWSIFFSFLYFSLWCYQNLRRSSIWFFYHFILCEIYNNFLQLHLWKLIFLKVVSLKRIINRWKLCC